MDSNSKSKSTTMTFKSATFKILFIIMIITFTFKCTVIPKAPPPASLVTFSVYEPLNYNCYTHHQGPGVAATKIKLHFNLKTQYINPRNLGVDYVDYRDASFDFNPATDTWPKVIVMEAPSKNPWYCEVIIVGTECAECANTYGLPTDIGGNCNAQTFSTNPLTYQGAKPRWDDRFTFRDVITKADLRSRERIPNVPASCDNNCIIN